MENRKDRRQDELFTAKALELARRGVGRVSPNPMVGCVIVSGGHIAGEGFHAYFGGPHAEIKALEKAGMKARGGTLYVNLEPCCHYGKTPPCTNAIIKSGIKRVVAAMSDPNPLVNGRGFELLKKSGVEIKSGVLADKAGELNRAFVKRVTTGLPYVTIKTAVSLDGKIAVSTGESRWISGEESRQWVHRFRSEVDAVLVGKNTARLDNPGLSAHGFGKDPARVVLDVDLELPANLKLFDVLKDGPKVYVAAGRGRQAAKKAELLRRKGIILLRCPVKRKAGVNGIDLNYLMKKLAAENISHVLIEGGGELNFDAIDRGIVDEVAFFMAPIIIGGRSAKTAVEGEGIKKLSDALRLNSVTVERVGEDILIRGRIKMRIGDGG